MNVPQNQDHIDVRIHIKPFMNFIWFSIVIMMFGGMISAITMRKIYFVEKDNLLHAGYINNNTECFFLFFFKKR